MVVSTILKSVSECFDIWWEDVDSSRTYKGEMMFKIQRHGGQNFSRANETRWDDGCSELKGGRVTRIKVYRVAINQTSDSTQCGPWVELCSTWRSETAVVDLRSRLGNSQGDWRDIKRSLVAVAWQITLMPARGAMLKSTTIKVYDQVTSTLTSSSAK